MRKPNFFIIGHTRSSGTSLEINLMQHPDIFIVSYKRGFFGFDTDFKNEEEYLELFKDAKNEKWVGERCSDYVFCGSTASRLKKYSPNAKILLILRNPIDVMHSLHSKMYSIETIEDIADFEDALNAEPKRLEENTHFPNKNPPQILYRTVVKYAKQLSKYYTEFGKENVKVIIFDDLIKNPTEVYSAIFEFLDIDTNFIPDFKKVNQNRNPRIHLLQSIIKKNSKVTNFLSKIPGTSTVYQNINLPVSKREAIPIELRRKLQLKLLPEIEELSKLLNRDLTFWCKN